MFDLLQIDTLQKAVNALPAAPEKISLWSLLEKGGWIMYPLYILLVAAIFVIASRRGMPETEVRSLTLFSLVLTIVSLIVVNRSFSASLRAAFRRPNPSLRWILAAVVAMLALTLLWPFASRLFRFGPLHLDDLTLVLGASVAVVVILEFLKPHWRERLRS